MHSRKNKHSLTRKIRITKTLNKKYFDHNLHISFNELTFIIDETIKKSITQNFNNKISYPLRTLAQINEFLLKSEFEAEIIKLKTLLIDSNNSRQQLKKFFLRLCLEREAINKDSLLSFSASPIGACNQLYWKLAQIIFRSRNLQEMFAILFPSIDECITINYKFKKFSPGKTFANKFDIELHRNSLTELANYPINFAITDIIFDKNIVFRLDQLENLPFSFQQHVYLLLDSYPQIKEKIYSHNSSLQELKNEIEWMRNKGNTPMEAIKNLIFDFKRFGQSETGNYYAQQGAMASFRDFMAYYQQLKNVSVTFQHSLSNLIAPEIPGGYRYTLQEIINNISTGGCIEVLGYKPLQRLIDHKPNHATLNTLPPTSATYFKNLNQKYGNPHIWSTLKIKKHRHAKQTNIVIDNHFASITEFTKQSILQKEKFINDKKRKRNTPPPLPISGNHDTNKIPLEFFKGIPNYTIIDRIGNLSEIFINFHPDQYPFLFTFKFSKELLPLLDTNKYRIIDILGHLTFSQQTAFFSVIVANKNNINILTSNLMSLITFISEYAPIFNGESVEKLCGKLFSLLDESEFLNFLKVSNHVKTILNNHSLVKAIYPGLARLTPENRLQALDYLSPKNATTLLHEALHFNDNEYTKFLNLYPDTLLQEALEKLNSTGQTVLALTACYNYGIFINFFKKYHYTIEQLLRGNPSHHCIAKTMRDHNLGNLVILFNSFSSSDKNRFVNYKYADGETFFHYHPEKLTHLFCIMSYTRLIKIITKPSHDGMTPFHLFIQNCTDKNDWTRLSNKLSQRKSKNLLTEIVNGFPLFLQAKTDEVFSEIINVFKPSELLEIITINNIKLINIISANKLLILCKIIQNQEFIENHLNPTDPTKNYFYLTANNKILFIKLFNLLKTDEDKIKVLMQPDDNGIILLRKLSKSILITITPKLPAGKLYELLTYLDNGGETLISDISKKTHLLYLYFIIPYLPKPERCKALGFANVTLDTSHEKLAWIQLITDLIPIEDRGLFLININIDNDDKTIFAQINNTLHKNDRAPFFMANITLFHSYLKKNFSDKNRNLNVTNIIKSLIQAISPSHLVDLILTVNKFNNKSILTYILYEFIDCTPYHDQIAINLMKKICKTVSADDFVKLITHYPPDNTSSYLEKLYSRKKFNDILDIIQGLLPNNQTDVVNTMIPARVINIHSYPPLYVTEPSSLISCAYTYHPNFFEDILQRLSPEIKSSVIKQNFPHGILKNNHAMQKFGLFADEKLPPMLNPSLNGQQETNSIILKK